jgi:hypothetical protein
MAFFYTGDGFLLTRMPEAVVYPKYEMQFGPPVSFGAAALPAKSQIIPIVDKNQEFF